MSTERELFEAWFQSLTMEQRYDFDSEGRGFKKDATHMMWLAWQAARSADTSGAPVGDAERYRLLRDNNKRHFWPPVHGSMWVVVYHQPPGAHVMPEMRGAGYGQDLDAAVDAAIATARAKFPEPPPATPGGPAGARRPDENSPSGPSDRALNPQPEAADHDRGAR